MNLTTMPRRPHPAKRRMLAAEVAPAGEFAQARPHPEINGRPGGKLAAPVFGAADRIRDAAVRCRAGRRS